MLKKVLIAIAVVVVVAVVVIAMQPPDFRVERTATMAAPAPAVFEQVNDFRKWEAWSPWLELDPQAKTSFEGPSSGTGAVFKWDGNSEVGAGSMTITESRPNDLIRIRLDFVRPLAGTNDVQFTFKPDGNQTAVTWSMYGETSFICKAMSLCMDMDKMIGDKYDEGLANMKAIVEAKR